MEELWGTFLGYMWIYQSRIIPVLLLGVVLEIIFLFLVKAGRTAYSAKSAHPFRRNGAPFRLKLSNAQLVN